MKHKPIKIDWDELEVAFSNQSEELVYFLDLVTGHVVLEGEGEEDDLDDDDEHFDRPRRVEMQRDDNTRAQVPRLDTPQKIVWMKAFIDEVRETEPAGASKLAAALRADDPPQAIREVLAASPEVRDRWYVYRSDRLHDQIDRWLGEQGVTVTDRPPWE